ncbi:hypothetical protein OCU04_010469 [Sclerotinia nivalis]|uniref:ABM domain-containing protein n=1 Tax=Sclerotinia nivalis TaxID=352851 RepID=A0A9X0ACB6_9HELO|nr:hypothetical protein OCU04_010469 [Sclerotinia nivalis]
MVVTEVGLMGVKAGLNVMDQSTPEGKILWGAWRAVVAAPGGPSKVYFGLEIEDPSKIWGFFDWKSIEEHQSFAKSFGGEAVKDLPVIMTHGEFTKHITLSPFSSAVYESPVTEVMIAYFASDISQAAKDTTTTQLKQYLEKSVKKCPDVKEVSYGWGVENDFPIRGGEPGKVGSILTAFIGWPSIDAHMKFRETEEFKDNVGLVTEMDGLVKLITFHLSCQIIERSE